MNINVHNCAVIIVFGKYIFNFTSTEKMSFKIFGSGRKKIKIKNSKQCAYNILHFSLCFFFFSFYVRHLRNVDGPDDLCLLNRIRYTNKTVELWNENIRITIQFNTSIRTCVRTWCMLFRSDENGRMEEGKNMVKTRKSEIMTFLVGCK